MGENGHGPGGMLVSTGLYNWNKVGRLWVVGGTPSCMHGTWPWGIYRRGILAWCESSIKERVGGVGLTLAGVSIKGMFVGKSFAPSRN